MIKNTLFALLTYVCYTLPRQEYQVRVAMVEEILLKIILTIVGFIVTGVLGYFVGKVKEYKKKDTRQEEALKCLLRSNITSKYYVYSEMGEIPYYEKENIDMMFEEYQNMDGNSYVETIVKEVNNLPIKK